MKFVRGDFKSVDPERGRFRSFVKTILFRMVALHYRKKSASKVKVVENVPEPERPAAAELVDDELFLQSWREDVLTRTWALLEREESQGGPAYNTILRVRVGNPTADSDQLATLLSQATGKSVTPGNARVQVHRAREKFAKLLIETIADSLDQADRDSIESELIELRLIDYCREMLANSKISAKNN